ncbi:WhiB family transcriptional regulator [Streptomyces sp. NPDC058459]|uniref:WhiB family transcriptional regulator n=1 Tax=Streptomyces sp. NPDC058459 TaxID=3346508 RepID=UPI00365FD079
MTTTTISPAHHRSLGDHTWQDQAVCQRTCLDAALEGGDTHGIRGGMTEEEREQLHEKVANRLDYSRVNATVAGRDVHLTKAERRAVVRAAYRHGITEQRLAWLLKVSDEHAQKLYRETRRAIRNRDLEQTTKTTPPPEPDGERLRRDDFGTAA